MIIDTKHVIGWYYNGYLSFLLVTLLGFLKPAFNSSIFASPSLDQLDIFHYTNRGWPKTRLCSSQPYFPTRTTWYFFRATFSLHPRRLALQFWCLISALVVLSCFVLATPFEAHNNTDDLAPSVIKDLFTYSFAGLLFRRYGGSWNQRRSSYNLQHTTSPAVLQSSNLNERNNWTFFVGTRLHLRPSVLLEKNCTWDEVLKNYKLVYRKALPFNPHLNEITNWLCRTLNDFLMEQTSPQKFIKCILGLSREHCCLYQRSSQLRWYNLSKYVKTYLW